jgi:hypothetical protein
MYVMMMVRGLAGVYNNVCYKVWQQARSRWSQRADPRGAQIMRFEGLHAA